MHYGITNLKYPLIPKNIVVSHCFLWLNIVNTLPLKRNKAY